MGTISVSLPSDGTTADVADYNTPINTIVNEFNGNIDNANIASAAAIAGSKLANASVTSSKIDFGGSGAGVWWEEIGRATLGSAGDAITISPLTAKKYLRVFVSLINSGSVSKSIRFNNDSASNYNFRYSTNGGADSSTGGAVARIDLASDTSTVSFHVIDIINIATQEKLVIGQSVDTGTAGAANVAGKWEVAGKWANTTDQITRIDVVNLAAGDLAAGSEIIVLGHN